MLKTEIIRLIQVEYAVKGKPLWTTYTKRFLRTSKVYLTLLLEVIK